MKIPCNTIIWRGVALAVLLLLPYKIAKAQQAEPYYWEWRAGLDYLFSNDEFGGSRHRLSSTYGGVWLTGGVALWWGAEEGHPATHSVHTALHLLKMQGMPHTIIDKGAITAYYQYQNSYTRLRIGAMPRQEVVGNYPSAFFTDSLLFHQPQLTGVVWQAKAGEWLRGQVWLDWSALGSKEQMESFQAGIEASAHWRALFVQLQSRLFHQGSYTPFPPDGKVLDHGQLLLLLGAKGQNIGKLPVEYKVAGGVLGAFERDRVANESYLPLGGYLQANLTYKWISTENTLYIGTPQLKLYPRYGTLLYWGNPLYQGNYNLESKWFLQLFNSEKVKVKVGGVLHLAEGRYYVQQQLTATIRLSPSLLNNRK